MWKNIAQPGRPQMKIWRIRITCWIPKVKNTHSYHVIRIALALNDGCTNASQHCVLLTFPVFCHIAISHTLYAEE